MNNFKVSATTDASAKDTQESWQHTKEEAKDTYDSAKKTVKNIGCDIMSKAQNMNDCVGKHPIKTIATSILIGWLIGKFV